MPVLGVEDSFHSKLAAKGSAVTKATQKQMDSWKFGSKKKSLNNYMLHQTVCYDDPGARNGVDKKGKDAGPLVPPKKGVYPRSAFAAWNAIATAMANSFHKDRAGVAIPKAAGGATFDSPFNPVMPAPLATAKLIKKDKWRDDRIKEILKWFMTNYDNACENGIKKGDVKYKAQTKLETKILAQFNSYYKGEQFGANGITLPSIVLDKMKNKPYPDYMPYCKPHKDAQDKSDSFPIEGGVTVRKGPEGYVMGPFSSNIQLIELEEKTTVDDNGHIEELNVYREDPSQKDMNKFIIDNEYYQDKLRQILGASYKTFRQQVKRTLAAEDLSPSGLPISDDEVLMPPENEGDPPKGLDSLPGDSKRVFNLDRRGFGLTRRGGNGAIENPDFDKPILDGKYGSANYDEDIDQRDWKDNNGNRIIFKPRANRGLTWGGPSAGGSFGSNTLSKDIQTVNCWQKFVKENQGTDAKAKSFSDPRTWGPYEEYTKDGRSTGADAADKAAGLDKLKYKYVIPTGLKTAIAAPDTVTVHKTENGLPGYGGLALPAMNKMFWGLRVLEAFPKARTLDEAIGEALKPPPKPKTTSTPTPIAGMAGMNLKNRTTFIGGPAPPFIIKCKTCKGDWKWGSKQILINGGNVFARTWGKKFSRGAVPGNLDDRYLWPKTFKKVPKAIDQKPGGTASGGMVWFDVSKQIIPTYAPPPLKPPMPNSKKQKWGPQQ